MPPLNKDGRAALCGLLVVDKPLGPTSMQVVARVRRCAGGARTGHAGTLDPLASGVLVIAIGRATKSIGHLMATDKAYRTVVDLSIDTVGHDLETAPQPVAVARRPARQDLDTALARFRGTFPQKPPARSAVKVGGRRAYARARQGDDTAPPARPVTVHALDIVRYAWPEVELSVRCAKGFYVRSLARDLGAALGTGGVCRSIVRTAVGPFTLEEAVGLDAVPEPLPPSNLMPIELAMQRVRDEASASRAASR